MSGSFAVLAPILKERALTEGLRYLLDSQNPHGLGDNFFRQIVAFCNLPKIKLSDEPHIVTATSEWLTDDRRRVDILAIARKNYEHPPSVIIGIEGKITAFESNSQISDYQKALCDAFKSPPKAVILLTTDGRMPKTMDSNNIPVIPMSWKKLAEIMCKEEFYCKTFVKEFADYISIFCKSSRRSRWR
jgi:hypothetical protein